MSSLAFLENMNFINKNSRVCLSFEENQSAQKIFRSLHKMEQKLGERYFYQDESSSRDMIQSFYLWKLK